MPAKTSEAIVNHKRTCRLIAFHSLKASFTQERLTFLSVSYTGTAEALKMKAITVISLLAGDHITKIEIKPNVSIATHVPQQRPIPALQTHLPLTLSILKWKLNGISISNQEVF